MSKVLLNSPFNEELRRNNATQFKSLDYIDVKVEKWNKIFRKSICYSEFIEMIWSIQPHQLF